MPDKVDEGKPNVDADPLEKDGKHPESVSWTQYVGIKEKFNKVETEYKGKVANLEEQLKATASKEELEKAKQELEATKAKHKEASEALEAMKTKTLAEKRDYLTKKGIPAEQLADLSDKEMSNIAKVLESYKPKPDLGGGGGSGGLKGSPMELARQAYTK